MMAVTDKESYCNTTNVLETPKKGNVTETIKSYMSRRQCNPFLKSVVSKYRNPVCSPSVFKYKSSNCEQDSPGGSIEYISLMRPVKIDENIIDNFQNELDPETENEAQQAIKRFFQSPPVDLNTPDRVEVKDIPFQYVHEAVSDYVDFEGKTSQTVLSFPNEICFNVEEQLDSFQLEIEQSAFTSEISPCGNFSSSLAQTNISLPKLLPLSLEQTLLPFQREFEETYSDISLLRRKLFGHDFNTSLILSPSQSEEDQNCPFSIEKQDMKHFVPSLSPQFLQESSSCSPVISGSLLHVSQECCFDHHNGRRAVGTPPGEVQPPLPVFDVSPIFKQQRPSRSASKLKFEAPSLERDTFGKLEGD